MIKGVGIFLGILGAIVGMGFLLQPTSIEEAALEAARVQATIDDGSGQGVLTQTSNLDVPDFTAVSTDGESITLSELVDDKPTLVGFWASWCPNCTRNLPVQNEIFQRYKDEVNIVEVNLNERSGTVDRYAEETDYDFPLVYDESGVISNAWGVQFTNTHYLIGADGTLIDAFPGDITEQHFEQLVAGVEVENEADPDALQVDEAPVEDSDS